MSTDTKKVINDFIKNFKMELVSETKKDTMYESVGEVLDKSDNIIEDLHLLSKWLPEDTLQQQLEQVEKEYTKKVDILLATIDLLDDKLDDLFEFIKQRKEEKCRKESYTSETDVIFDNLLKKLLK